MQSEFTAETEYLKNQIKEFKANTVEKIEENAKQYIPGLPGL